MIYSLKSSNHVEIAIMDGERDPNNVEVGKRLKSLRLAMGYGYHGGATKWAVWLGIGLQRWSNIERGDSALSREVLELVIAKCPGLTRDWIVAGDASGLNQLWLRRLGLMTDR